MKFKIAGRFTLAALLAFQAFSEERVPAEPAAAPPDDQKISYALGMNLALQIKQIGAEVDMAAIARGMRDVLAGKPTEIQESELRPLFAQSQAYELARKVEKNKSEGATFLARNAKEPGVVVLPDGLQYRILQPGAGETPKDSDFVKFNVRGSWINGVEFLHKDGLERPLTACPKGIQEALRSMKTGARWRIFTPSELCYGQRPGRPAGFGSTLIYDLELASFQPPATDAAGQYSGGTLGHAPGDEFLPVRLYVSPASQTNRNSSGASNAPVALPAAPTK